MNRKIYCNQGANAGCFHKWLICICRLQAEEDEQEEEERMKTIDEPLRGIDEGNVIEEESDDDCIMLTQACLKFGSTRSSMKLEEEEDDELEEMTLRNAKRWNKHDAFHAAPAPENAPQNQDLKGVPSVLPKHKGKTVRCGRCNVVVPPKPLSNEMQGVTCCECRISYHLKCANMSRPPRYAHAWLCEACLLAGAKQMDV